MNRRSFLKAVGGAVIMSAGGIALIEAEPIVRTYFLPPRCGWNAGTFELACAQEALRIVNEKLGVPTGIRHRISESEMFEVIPDYARAQTDSLLARRARLVERCDKLARGWIPTRSHRTLYAADGTAFQTTIHGGRT